jgi:type I restriction enzyme, S subunit
VGKYQGYERYKDSGVEWLGAIPDHWIIKKIQYVGRLKSGENIVSQQIDKEGLYPVFGGNGLRGYFDSYTHDGHYILIGRQGALCGNINYGNGKFWASEHAVVVLPSSKFNVY